MASAVLWLPNNVILLIVVDASEVEGMGKTRDNTSTYDHKTVFSLLQNSMS